MRWTIAEISPPEAARILAAGGRGRAPGQAEVLPLVLPMRRSAWVLNGSPIVLSAEGAVLDGRKRLRACMTARAPFQTALLTDVPGDLIRGAARRRDGFAAILRGRGLPAPRALADCLVVLARYRARTLGSEAAPPCWPTLDLILRAHPNLPHFVAHALRHPDPLFPDAVRIPFGFMAAQADGPALARLIGQMGEDTTEGRPTTPGGLLAEALRHRTVEDPHTPRAVRLLALAILAFNAERHARPLARLAWKPAHGFPVMDGYQPPRIEPLPVAVEQDTPAAREAWTATLSAEFIGPAEARRYLGDQSAEPDEAALALCRVMRRGEWALDPQPICLAPDGTLLDGRARLRAVIAAQSHVFALVARGVPPGAAGTYGGAARALPTKGPDATTVQVAMANLLWTREVRASGTLRAKATPGEIAEILRRHPRLLDIGPSLRRLQPLAPLSIVGYVAYVAEREEAELAPLFLRGLLDAGPHAALPALVATRRRLTELKILASGRAAKLEALLEGWRSYRRTARRQMAARGATAGSGGMADGAPKDAA